MGVRNFSRRISLSRHRGKRGSVFCNEWLWEFFPEGYACLGTEARGTACFVMNVSAKFLQNGLLV